MIESNSLLTASLQNGASGEAMLLPKFLEHFLVKIPWENLYKKRFFLSSSFASSRFIFFFWSIIYRDLDVCLRFWVFIVALFSWVCFEPCFSLHGKYFRKRYGVFPKRRGKHRHFYCWNSNLIVLVMVIVFVYPVMVIVLVTVFGPLLKL